MTGRSVQHGMFEIERVYDASPERVFNAWADPVAKAQWFGPTAPAGKIALDFRVGGREHFKATLPDGRVFGFDARYQEIVPGHRIVYAYTIDFDQTRISASLSTVEITPAGERTRLLYTEQAVYLDGGDTPPDREQGTREELDKLDVALSSALAPE